MNLKLVLITAIALLYAFNIACAEEPEPEQIALTTYYPAPYGEYSDLDADTFQVSVVRLVPKGPAPAGPAQGVLYYHDGTVNPEGIYYYDSSSAWKSLGGGGGSVWQNDTVVPGDIYYEGGNARLGAGVAGGSPEPGYRFTVIAKQQYSKETYGLQTTAIGINSSCLIGNYIRVGGTGNNSNMAAGVHSHVYCALSGTTYGVFGSAGGGKSYNIGIEGYVASATATNNYGISGKVNAISGNCYGVYGEKTGPGSGYAGYFKGNVHVTGSLTKSSGSFVQPHPTDPKKQIYYSFFEGRDNRIFLDGVAKLKNGQALIDIPEDFRLVASKEAPLNVIITPFADVDIFVAQRSLNNITVRSRKPSNAEFGYMVIAARGGFEESKPVQENIDFMPGRGETIKEFEESYIAYESDPHYSRLTKELNRNLLIKNGILLEDGKVNTELLKELNPDALKEQVRQPEDR